MNVINESKAQVDVKESDNGKGGKDIQILISEITGQEARRYGSPLNRSLRDSGAANPLIRR